MPDNPLKIAYGSEQLPLKIGPMAIPCFILENGEQVFARNDLQKLLGYDGKSDDWLLDLLGSINKFYPVPGLIFNSLEEPLIFEIDKNDGSAVVMKGIPAHLLPEICKTIADAKSNGYVSVSQLKFAKSAETVLKNSSGLDLEQAISAASGFIFHKERAKEQVQRFLQSNTPESAFQWAGTLPDSFFESLFSLYGTNWTQMLSQPQTMAGILNELVFSRITNEVLDDLRNTKPKRAYRNKKGLFNDIQHPGLKTYTAALSSLVETSANDLPAFMRLVDANFPIKNRLLKSALFDTLGASEEPVSELEKQLIKGVSLNRTYFKAKKLSK